MLEQQVVKNFHVWIDEGRYLILAPVSKKWIVTDAQGFDTLKMLLKPYAGSEKKQVESSAANDKLAQFIERNVRTTHEVDATIVPSVVPSLPEKIYLYMTTNCNIRCAYCYATKYIDKLPVMSYEQGVAILEKCKKEMPTAKIIFTGGEPLTDKNTYKLLQHAKSLGLKVRVETNGTVINEDKIDLLRGTELQVSLDALNAEINNMTRGRFEQAANGLNLLQENGLRPEIATTLTANNINYAINFFNYWRKRGVNVRFHTIRKFGTDKEYAKLAVKNEDLIRLFDNLAKEVGSYKKAAHIINLEDQLSFDEPILCCEMGQKCVAIDGAGQVYSCVHLCQPDMTMGNILQSDINTLVGSTQAQQLRVPVSQLPTCQECPLRYFCGGGCRAEAYYTQKEFAHKYVHCEFIQHVIVKCLLEEANE